MTDFARAHLEEALQVFGQGTLRYAVIPGKPWAKGRPRHNQRTGGTFTTRADKDAEERTAWALRSGIRYKYHGNVALVCIFYLPDFRRIDYDNMLKHVCDAANHVIYEDDSQVTACLGVIMLDPDNPRTVVIFGEHYGCTLPRGRNNDRRR